LGEKENGLEGWEGVNRNRQEEGWGGKSWRRGGVKGKDGKEGTLA